MKTLNKRITAEFFRDESGYGALVCRWSALMQDREQRKNLTCAHHLLYLILRGKNWLAALTPPTNRRKLDNGAYYGWIAHRAMAIVTRPFEPRDFLAPFADLLRDDVLDRIREVMASFRWGEDLQGKEPYVD